MEREGVTFFSRTRTQTWRQAHLYGQPSTTMECCEYSYGMLAPQHYHTTTHNKHTTHGAGWRSQTLAHERQHWHIRANTGTYAQTLAHTTLLRVFLGWWLFFLLICRLSKGTYAYGSGRPACGVQRATQETIKEGGGGKQSEQESTRERASKMASGREGMRARGAGRLWAAADFAADFAAGIRPPTYPHRKGGHAYAHARVPILSAPIHKHIQYRGRIYTNTYITTLPNTYITTLASLSPPPLRAPPLPTRARAGTFLRSPPVPAFLG